MASWIFRIILVSSIKTRTARIRAKDYDLMDVPVSQVLRERVPTSSLAPVMVGLAMPF